MATSIQTRADIYAERDLIESAYRSRFNDAPPIYFITKGGVVAGRRSEDEAWELCRKAAESGTKLVFYKAPSGVDLA